MWAFEIKNPVVGACHSMRVGLYFFLLIVLSAHSVNATGADKSLVLSQSNFVYTPAQMLNFDIRGYLSNQAPHLLSQAEAISHWSGRSTISPKVILALLEHQSQGVTKQSSRKQLSSAF